MKDNVPQTSENIDDKQEGTTAWVQDSIYASQEFESQGKASLELHKPSNQTTELLSWRKPIESPNTTNINQPDTKKFVPYVDLAFDQGIGDFIGDNSVDDGDDASSYTTQESGPIVVVSKSRSKEFINF